jgi:hypothetical protein
MPTITTTRDPQNQTSGNQTAESQNQTSRSEEEEERKTNGEEPKPVVKKSHISCEKA